MATLHRRRLLHLIGGMAASAMPLASTPVHAGADWRLRWDKLIAAAQAEGALSLITWAATWGGVGFSAAIDAFTTAFPGITVQWLPESAADVWLAAVRRERAAQRYSFDLAIVQPDAALTTGAQDGLWAPLQPLLFHPEVSTDDAWRDGFAARFLDTAGNSAFSWEYQAIHTCAINRNFVDAAEITSVADLVQPPWTGKIIAADPRVGIGLTSAAAISRHWGTDMLRRLLVEQQPTITSDPQELAEGLDSGRYLVAMGLRPKALEAFQQEHPGRGKQITLLDLPDADFAGTTPLLFFDRSPHPAAAALFANWILTREGQTILTSALPTNSARSDVAPVVLDSIATPGQRYYEPDREANFAHTAETATVVRNLLG